MSRSSSSSPIRIALILSVAVLPAFPALLSAEIADGSAVLSAPVHAASIAPSREEIVESLTCEMRAAQDGSLEEQDARVQAGDAENRVRELGLLDDPLGEEVVKMARRMSRCEPVAKGATICETLDNHRYSKIDPECRRLLRFDDARHAPAVIGVPPGQDPKAWAVVAIIGAQMETVYPSLRDGEFERGIDPRYSNPALYKFVWDVAYTVVVTSVAGGIIGARGFVVDEIHDAAWSGHAQSVLDANKTDLGVMWNAQDAIDALRLTKAANAEVLDREIKALDAVVRSGVMTNENVREFRQDLIDRDAAASRSLDEQVSREDKIIKARAEAVEERSEEFLEERKREIDKACEQRDCPQYEIGPGSRQTFERELASCKTRYRLDPTIEAMAPGVVTPDGLPGNPALGPRCSIKTFERIMSGFSERTRTLADVFGDAGAHAEAEARALQDRRDAEDNFEDALAAHEAACRHDEATCACRDAEARLDRATERLYLIEKLPSDIAQAYMSSLFAAEGLAGEDAAAGAGGEDATAGRATSIPDALNRCGREMRSIYREDPDGTKSLRFVLPGNPDYPEWPSRFFCTDIRIPLRDPYDLAVVALGAPPTEAYSQGAIDAMIQAAIDEARPLGGDLLEAQRRGWRADTTCEVDGFPIDALPWLPLSSSQADDPIGVSR